VHRGRSAAVWHDRAPTRRVVYPPPTVAETVPYHSGRSSDPASPPGADAADVDAPVDAPADASPAGDAALEASPRAADPRKHPRATDDLGRKGTLTDDAARDPRERRRRGGRGRKPQGSRDGVRKSRSTAAPDEPGSLLTGLDETLPSVRGEGNLGEGAKVGRYDVLERVGAGGMGVVFRAYDPVLGREVAVKLLRPSGSDPSGPARAPAREAQAMAQLAHPNVVTVYDVGEHEGAVYMAMELVEASPLRRLAGREAAVARGAGRVPGRPRARGGPRCGPGAPRLQAGQRAGGRRRSRARDSTSGSRAR
jgi:hypothetical protein